MFLKTPSCNKNQRLFKLHANDLYLKTVVSQRKKTGGCQMKGIVGADRTGEGNQDLQTSSYRVSHGYEMYSMKNIVYNNVISLYSD